MTVKEILDTVLDEQVSPEICGLIEKGFPVIIDGDRSRPTGKSWLCDQLRKAGCEAYEGWEIEEGYTVDGEIIKKSDSENALFLTVRLDKRLSDAVTRR